MEPSFKGRMKEFYQIAEMHSQIAALVTLLSRVFPTHREPVSAEKEDGQWLVMESPAGQLAWHVRPNDGQIFKPIPIGNPTFDGHDTFENVKRVQDLTWNINMNQWWENLRKWGLPHQQWKELPLRNEIGEKSYGNHGF